MTQNLRIVPVLFSFSFDRPGLLGRIGSRVGSGATLVWWWWKTGHQGGGCSVPVFGARSGSSPARSKKAKPATRGKLGPCGSFRGPLLVGRDLRPLTDAWSRRWSKLRCSIRLYARSRSSLAQPVRIPTYRRREGRHPAMAAREGQISIHSGPPLMPPLVLARSTTNWTAAGASWFLGPDEG
jgi:hypothetical protein